jgi:transaldolase
MKQSPTEFWINNPTRHHADLAIANGATGCTNNPSYTQKMLDHPEEGEYALKFLDEAVKETDNDLECAEVFQRKMVKPIADKFLPIYERTEGQRGHVSIQGDPINEDDPDIIIRDALANRKVAQNICCKIPTTTSGLKAMEMMIEEDIAINATEIFGVSQMVMVCEKYLEISKRTGKKPAFYMSHIAGIYDDYLKNYVEKNHIDISPDVLYQGGLAVARKVYDIMIERNYPCSFIGGGARGLQHFTEMVGGKVCITINWEGTADKLIEQNPPVVWRLFNPVSQYVIDELMEKLPDFKRGYLEDGLEPEEFDHFGPVMLFRDSFIKSWQKAIQIAKDRRAALVNA